MVQTKLLTDIFRRFLYFSKIDKNKCIHQLYFLKSCCNIRDALSVNHFTQQINITLAFYNIKKKIFCILIIQKIFFFILWNADMMHILIINFFLQ